VTIRQALGLNLDSLNGSLWQALWRAVVAFGILLAAAFLVEHFLPVGKVHDPAAEFAASLTGAPAAIFAALGVLVAPVVEELVFRGFLYNSLRTSLRSPGWLKLLRSTQAIDFLAALVSATVFGLFHMNFLNPSQINWPALPVYMVTGLILAESYRRSGSL